MMNYWITAVLSLIFVAVFGTLAANTICNHIIDVYNVARLGTPNKKLTNLMLLLERFAVAMLCGLTVSGLTCLIFSVVKLMGG